MTVGPLRRALLGAVVTAATLGALGPVGMNRVLAATTTDVAEPAPDQALRVGPPPLLYPVVLGEIPHDTTAFTEGFETSGGVLYEGTGLTGQSELRELDPATGAVRRAVPLPDELFGEGITVVDDRIWQLTYRDGVVLEWNRRTLTLQRQIRLDGEGWGLCHDRNRLIRSDGTGVLSFHDPNTFTPTGSVTVTRDGAPVTRLNELECVDGQVYANVWMSNEILRIDPLTGTVTAVIDTTGLLDDPNLGTDDVLNGIAHVAGGEFLLTGKRWPLTFRVCLSPTA